MLSSHLRLTVGPAGGVDTGHLHVAGSSRGDALEPHPGGGLGRTP